jgi:cell division septation protein DedD
MLWGEDVTEPEAAQAVDAGPPGLVTAWGEQLILSRAGAHELVQLGLPGLEPTESVRLDARPFTLAASPSSHRIYVGLDGERALIVVDRFSWRPRERGRFQTPIRELRPSTAGDYILAFDGSVAWLLLPESDDPIELDLEWRSDLPIGLPGGGVLGVRDGAMWMLTVPGDQANRIDAAAGAWWLPVSWVPSRQRMQVARRRDEPEPEGAAEGPDREPGEEPEPVAQTETEEVTTEADAAVGAGVGAADVESAVPVVSVPPGFYAVAASSQRVGGVHDLSEALEGDGYPALVVPRRDEANEIWYRVMVGPFGTRDEAEDTLLRLRRERGIQGWVREVTQGDFGTGEGAAP